ncbi:MAG: hypothetical protein HPY44_17290 [Armatimonadetes bacterium]|nr:hypothetical protein [Armatimonadota bacterium]
MRETPSGRSLVRAALSGQATERVPVALFTWGFDYTWQVAGLEPWELAFADRETWHEAHLALLRRHRPDALFYNGPGGDDVPVLVETTASEWHIARGNARYRMDRTSLAVTDAADRHVCDPVGELRTREDIDRAVPADESWGAAYLEDLARLIAEVGDEAMVFPHHSPAYIRACYAFGFERAMELMLTDPDLFVYACERYAASDRRLMREWRDAGAEVAFIADGWASCDIISPAMFDRFALPYQRSITEAAHEAGLRIVLWNEGDVLPILDREAALPVDAFAFEQPRKGANLTVDRVRAVFGDKRCLFGNLDSELLLLRNDPDEIARAVKAQLASSGENAPFVLCTGSPLPSNVSSEAVDTMFQCARRIR